MNKQIIEDPLWSFYRRGNKILRERIIELDRGLATKLAGVWLTAFEDVLQFETGKRRQGISHALEVDNNIGLVLEHFALLKNMKAIDLFILSAAAVLHDFDKVMEKSGKYRHGPSGRNRLRKPHVRLSLNLDPIQAEAIGYLIAAHDRGNLNMIPEDPFRIGSPPATLLRSLAAILRLCDMLDLTYKRCPEVIERIRGITPQEIKTLWDATQIIGGWGITAKKVVLQVIRKHSEEDELALRAIVDALHRDITPSHRRYLENCVIIAHDGKRISARLPTEFELDKIGLKFDTAGGLQELYDGFIESYLKELHKTVKFVDLNQVGIIIEKQRPPLSDIFIDIKLKRSDKYSSLPTKLRNYMNSPTILSEKSAKVLADLAKYEEISISETLETDEIGHLVILGHAGAGKSTIAQYICLLLSLSKYRGSTRIPFEIPVRIFVSEKNKRKGNYSLVDYILDEINLLKGPRQRKRPRSFVEYCLQGESFVILDGLDEVPDINQRKDVCVEALKLMTDFQNVRLIITSRVHGYREAPFSWAGFLHLELETVKPESVETFIKKWYKYRESNMRRREEKIAHFHRAMNDKAVRELTSNPLMLTIMALVNEKGPLPRLRTKLYDTCVTTYLEREGLKDLLWYDVDEVRSVHEDLGYWIHSKFEFDEKQQEVDVRALKQRMFDFLSSRSPLASEIQEEKVMRFITLAKNRIGLITESIRGYFSFGVRPIREFLAASYINDFKAYGIDDLWKFVGGRVFNPYWHEVIRFLVGILSQTAREQFLNKIMKTKSEEGLTLASEIVIEKNPVSGNLRFQICEKCIEVVMSVSSEESLTTFTNYLTELLETAARDLILRQIERESSGDLVAGLEYFIFLKKHRWSSTQKQVDLISAALMKPWKGKKLSKICARALKKLAKETDALREDALVDLLDNLSQDDEGHILILEEAKKLSKKQMYFVALLIHKIPGLKDLDNLLRELAHDLF